MSAAVLVDMDGTLVDVSHLRHFVEGPGKDFDSFHKLSLDAPPHDWVVSEVNQWAMTHKILIVTARNTKYDDVTWAWLDRNGVAFDKLYSRGLKDFRADYEVKKDILQKVKDDGFTPVWAYDDNPNTFPLWANAGIPTTIVPGWPRHWATRESYRGPSRQQGSPVAVDERDRLRQEIWI